MEMVWGLTVFIMIIEVSPAGAGRSPSARRRHDGVRARPPDGER